MAVAGLVYDPPVLVAKNVEGLTVHTAVDAGIAPFACAYTYSLPSLPNTCWPRRALPILPFAKSAAKVIVTKSAPLRGVAENGVAILIPFKKRG
jgi:hypothetical protein